MSQNIFLLHLFTAIFMTGLIWTIQLVHYPSFHFVDKANFVTFEAFHSGRISYIVLPVMIAELLSAFALVYYFPQFRVLALVNIVLLGSIWLITLLVSARLHGELMAGYNETKVTWLINSNWFRTGLWSLRALGLVTVARSIVSL